ncbi:MAG TPA: thiamine-phosphate kinase [Verrucomicrobiales bacterium]|nr:thiamine-phosphate kinase [Verrucomicrobiales bacterium]|tara:strand:+ start:1091 stop:1966 length:876 start_codon:yes stop_codon:yes gene_type:complete
MKTIGEFGEDGLIAQLCEGLPSTERVVVGPGDDCAVVEVGDEWVLLKTDAVVEGVHYLSGENPKRVGWKAVARVLSDFAAMGGEPGEFLVTVAVSRELEVRWLTDLYEGIKSCLGRFGGVIVGGETSSLPVGSPTVISIAGRGRLSRKRLVTRSGGKAGDGIFVTGVLGGSINGKHLDFYPRLREATWLTENFSLTAMMDLSDGLAKDLPRLAKASGCGFSIEKESVPCSEDVSLQEALGDGEDYELLFTCDQGSKLLEKWAGRFPGLRLTRIGELTADQEDSLVGGWDHF